MYSFTVFNFLVIFLLSFIHCILASDNGKATLSMRMAQDICRQAAQFAQSNELQHPTKDSSQLPPGAKGKKSCKTKTIQWNKCELSNSSCSKFELKKNVKISTRIAYGDERGKGEFLFHARVAALKSCSGVIISHYYVLTAAQCFDPGQKQFDNVKVIGGANHYEELSGKEQQRSISAVFIYEKYDPDSLEHDIALIRVRHPFQFGADVQPILVPDRRYEAKPSESVYISGWGNTEAGKAEYLYGLQLFLGRDSDCQLDYTRGRTRLILNAMICTEKFANPDYEEGTSYKGYCAGDRGGPLSQKIESCSFDICAPGCSRLIGIASPKMIDADCKTFDKMNVFTEVAKYKDWIQSKIIFPYRPPRPRNRRSLSPRIYAGENANADEFPFQVRIYRNDQLICSGSLITYRFVLTSALCVFHDRTKNLQYYNSIKIVAGGYRLNTKNRGQLETRIDRIWMHDDFDSVQLQADIAVLRLVSTLPDRTEAIKIIQRPLIGEFGAAQSGSILTAVGHGHATANANVLQKHIMKIVESKNCIKAYGCAMHGLKVLCVEGHQHSAGICGVDMGGPLFSASTTGEWKIFGIASWRPFCQSDAHPSVYTSVISYIGWIRMIIDNPDNQRS